MKAAEIKATAMPAKSRTPFFQKGAQQGLVSSAGSEQPFFQKKNNDIPAVQAKLTIGQPNGKYEQEADAVADKVVQRLSNNDTSIENTPGKNIQAKPLVGTPAIPPFVQAKCASCDQEEKLQKKEKEDETDLLNGKLQKKPIFESNAEPTDDEKSIQRKCTDCEKKDKLQKKSEGTAHPASQSIESSLSSSKGSGSPLPADTRTQMESSMAADFSNVRIHNDSSAAQMNKEIHAQAFTHGDDIYFNSGKYDPNTRTGKHLLAHELTHSIQQGSAKNINPIQPFREQTSEHQIMRSLVKDSTVNICHRVLESSYIKITQGGLRVVILLNPLNTEIPNCQNHKFWVSLTRSVDWGFDDEIATCEGETGGTRSFSFGNLPSGTYYLTIHRVFDHPYCCIDGDILVFDEPISGDGTGCVRDKDLSAMDIVHGALDIAGFIPVLGAIPDGINAAIYAVEGDWANAGLSAVAMVPAWGDGVKLAAMTGKVGKGIIISEKAAIKLGEEGIAKGLKEVKAASKAADEAAVAAEKAAKEVAEKALKEKIRKCLAIYAAKEALGDCVRCKGTDTPTERAAKIACLTAEIAARTAYLKEDCDDVLQDSIDRKKKGQDPKGGHQTQLTGKIQALAKCAKLPTK